MQLMSSSRLTAASPFEAIYQETFEFVSRTLRHLGVAPADLDDALQDVYVVVHRRLPGFEGRSTLTTWIYGIARRIAAEHRRRRPAATVAPLALTGAADPVAGPYEEVVKVEAAVELGRLLGELPLDKREVFILAELEAMSGPEIARCLALDVETVYWRLRAARAAFDQALDRHNAREAWRDRHREEPDDRTRRRVWTAIAAAVGLGASRGAAALALTAAVPAVVVGVLIAAVAPLEDGRDQGGRERGRSEGAVVGAERLAASPSPTPIPTVTPLPAPSPPPTASSLRIARPTRVSSLASTHLETPRAARPAVIPVPPSPSPSPTRAADHLAAEARLLLEVDRAIRRGDRAAAERGIAEHRRRYPDGALSRERGGLAAAAAALNQSPVTRSQP